MARNSNATVLITAPYFVPVVERYRSELERVGVRLLCPPVRERLSESELMALAGSFDGVICGDDPFTQSVLEACAPRLRVISKWGTGIDAIDKIVAARLGIRVCNTPDAFTIPVAESVLGYMLAFARRQPWMNAQMKAGVWQKVSCGVLHGATLGVVGVGNIGKAVLRRASAFGMKLLGNDIVDIEPGFLREVGVSMVTLDELLRSADYVSVNPDLNPSSFHLINAARLARMKPDAVLINCSRGPVVQEADLIAALQRGAIRGAALDVFEDEPLPENSPLRGFENVLLAPHNSNSSRPAWEHVHANTVRNLLDGLGISEQIVVQEA